MSANHDVLVQDIANAYRDPSLRIAATRLIDLTREDALAIQGDVLKLLGESAPVAKVAIAADGTGNVAPIPSALVTDTGGTMVLGVRDLVGLEVEVAVRLGADITPDLARQGADAVLKTIDGFILGIELIGSRIDDRTAAGAFGPLADNMVSGGYVRGATVLAEMPAADGLAVEMTCDGAAIQKEVAKYPFGDAIRPIIAYALSGGDQFGALRKGMVVTTGSLSPLLISPRQGHIEIKLGDYPAVAVTLR